MTDAPDLGPTPADPSVLELDAAACYWALFEEPIRPTHGPRGLSLRSERDEEPRQYAFEAWLPVPIDELECRFVVVGAARSPRSRVVLACGLERERLRTWIERAEAEGASLVSVRPASPPACVACALGSDTAHDALLRALDFRVGGAFENPRRVRRRRLAAASLAASLGLSCLIISAGLVRGALLLNADARDAADAASALTAASLGLADEANRSAGVDAALALDAALTRLARTRGRSMETLVSPDRGATLVELLAAWPEGFPTRLEQAHLEQGSITLRGEVRDTSDFERLTLAVGGSLGASGWTEQSKSGTKSKDAFSFALTFRRDRAGAGRSPLGAPSQPDGPTAVSAPVAIERGRP